MRQRPLWLFLTAASCAAPKAPPSPAAAPLEETEHHEPAHRGEHRFTDPDALAAAWNDPARDAWQRPDQIVAAAELRDGDAVVDLGVGTGYLLPHLVGAVGATGSVIALDIEPSMLDFVAAAAKEQGWATVRPHLATPDDPQLPASSVDAVVTLNTWHHIADRPAYAARLLTALRPGGRFVVVDFLKEETPGGGPPLAMRLTAEEIAADLTAAGFATEVVEEEMPRHHVVRGRRPDAP